MATLITISKLDAAKRQLDAYIRLYFYSSDPVAMHTLVAAAFGIIRDLNRKRGGSPTIQESLLQHVKPEHMDMVRGKLTEAQNFFKHADRDHGSSLDFYPDSTELVAFDASVKYSELTGEVPPLFQIFNGWMMISHPDMFDYPPDRRRELESAAATFLPTGKGAYFKDMLPLVMQNGA